MELRGSEILKNVTEFTKSMGQEWASMTDEQKKMYNHDQELGMAILAKSAQMAEQDSTLKALNGLTVTNDTNNKVSKGKAK